MSSVCQTRPPPAPAKESGPDKAPRLPCVRPPTPHQPARPPACEPGLGSPPGPPPLPARVPPWQTHGGAPTALPAQGRRADKSRTCVVGCMYERLTYCSLAGGLDAGARGGTGQQQAEGEREAARCRSGSQFAPLGRQRRAPPSNLLSPTRSEEGLPAWNESQRHVARHKDGLGWAGICSPAGEVGGACLLPGSGGEWRSLRDSRRAALLACCGGRGAGRKMLGVSLLVGFSTALLAYYWARVPKVSAAFSSALDGAGKWEGAGKFSFYGN